MAAASILLSFWVGVLIIFLTQLFFCWIFSFQLNRYCEKILNAYDQNGNIVQIQNIYKCK